METKRILVIGNDVWIVVQGSDPVATLNLELLKSGDSSQIQEIGKLNFGIYGLIQTNGEFSGTVQVLSAPHRTQPFFEVSGRKYVEIGLMKEIAMEGFENQPDYYLYPLENILALYQIQRP